MGNSEVVSVGMLTTEDEESLSCMFRSLRERNPEMERLCASYKDRHEKKTYISCMFS